LTTQPDDFFRRKIRMFNSNRECGDSGGRTIRFLDAKIPTGAATRLAPRTQAAALRALKVARRSRVR